jgi:predicted RNase H-like nuclease (RuvC/YqgF family)
MSSRRVTITSKKNTTPLRTETDDDTNRALYNKKVKQYFTIKSEWETTHKAKKSAKCLICNHANARMTFEVTRDLYLAKCGKDTCTMEIPRKSFISFEEKMQQMQEKLKNLKLNFIIQKQDTIHRFIDDKNAIKVFKDEFEEYRELVKVFDQYNTQQNNTTRQTRIDELKTALFKECQEIKQLEETITTTATNTATTNTIQEIVDIVFNKLTPLTVELQSLTYPIMELNVTKTGELRLYQRDEITQFVEIQ